MKTVLHISIPFYIWHTWKRAYWWMTIALLYIQGFCFDHNNASQKMHAKCLIRFIIFSHCQPNFHESEIIQPNDFHKQWKKNNRKISRAWVSGALLSYASFSFERDTSARWEIQRARPQKALIRFYRSHLKTEISYIMRKVFYVLNNLC